MYIPVVLLSTVRCGVGRLALVMNVAMKTAVGACDVEHGIVARYATTTVQIFCKYSVLILSIFYRYSIENL